MVKRQVKITFENLKAMQKGFKQVLDLGIEPSGVFFGIRPDKFPFKTRFYLTRDAENQKIDLDQVHQLLRGLEWREISDLERPVAGQILILGCQQILERIQLAHIGQNPTQIDRRARKSETQETMMETTGIIFRGYDAK